MLENKQIKSNDGEENFRQITPFSTSAAMQCHEAEGLMKCMKRPSFIWKGANDQYK